MARSAIVALTLIAAAPGVAHAHDLWIEPSSFHPAPGQQVTVALRVGQRLLGEPMPRVPELVDRFFLAQKGAEVPVTGEDGADPAGAVKVSAPGLQWIAYQSHPYPVTLIGPKFEEYLAEEGLDAVIEARAKSGQKAAPGKERFYRCAKALLRGGGEKSGAFDVPLGLTLELVPLSSPLVAPALELSLRFRGKPVAGARVTAIRRADPDHPIAGKTDARGRVTLETPGGGFWMVKAVHMEPAPPGLKVDWESWWASITFER